MKDIFEKAKKLLPFFEKYKKYFAASGLFVAMVLILYFFTGEDYIADRMAEINSRPVSGEDYVPDKEFEVDAYEEVNELISTYFEAYVNADFETIDMVADPVSDMEKSYITVMSQYFEEYQNIKCYTKHGLSKDSFIVAACFDIKFLEQEVTAPSMMLFYVQTNDEGELYINNLYSDFNRKYKESAVSSDVNTAFMKYTMQDDYLELYNEVDNAFQNLIKENEAIYTLTKRTIPAMRQEWEDTVYYAHEDEMEESESTEATETTEGTEGTEINSGTGSDTQVPSTEGNTTTDSQDSQEPTVVYVKVKTDNVRVRSMASTESDTLGEVNQGDTLEKLGVEGDWTKVKFDGKTGYIKSSLLE